LIQLPLQGGNSSEDFKKMNYGKILGYTLGVGMAGLCAYLIKDGLVHKDNAEVTAGAVNTFFAGITGVTIIYPYVKEDIKDSVKKLFSHKDKHTDITDKF
jgi:hypothetical protein